MQTTIAWNCHHGPSHGKTAAGTSCMSIFHVCAWGFKWANVGTDPIEQRHHKRKPAPTNRQSEFLDQATMF